VIIDRAGIRRHDQAHCGHKDGEHAYRNQSLEPIKTPYRLRYVADEQLQQLQEATLQILETTGVKFTSESALQVLAEHGARVDFDTQVVRFPREVVFSAMKTVPRRFNVGGRTRLYDFHLGDGCTYFTTDGCGVETIDLETRERRPSRKADVAMMARVVDYLPGIAFYWPMVSSQEHGRTAPLHDLDAGFRNTLKHMQSETIMGEADARYAVEMSTVIAGEQGGDAQAAKLLPAGVHDRPTRPGQGWNRGRDGAGGGKGPGGLPGHADAWNHGARDPGGCAGDGGCRGHQRDGADADGQSGGARLPFHHAGLGGSKLREIRELPVGSTRPVRPVDMAHHWGMPCLGACYGTDAHDAGTWAIRFRGGADAFMIGLTGVEWVTGLGLTHTYTRLYPESLLLDYDLYQKARYALMSWISRQRA